MCLFVVLCCIGSALIAICASDMLDIFVESGWAQGFGLFKELFGLLWVGMAGKDSLLRQVALSRSLAG